jgi:hypothetical protein
MLASLATMKLGMELDSLWKKTGCSRLMMKATIRAKIEIRNTVKIKKLVN